MLVASHSCLLKVINKTGYDTKSQNPFQKLTINSDKLVVQAVLITIGQDFRAQELVQRRHNSHPPRTHSRLKMINYQNEIGMSIPTDIKSANKRLPLVYHRPMLGPLKILQNTLFFVWTSWYMQIRSPGRGPSFWREIGKL